MLPFSRIAGGELFVDTSELTDLIDKIKAAKKNGTKASAVSKQINPKDILLNYGAPMGVAVLMKHTPVGDNFSNWGYWDYGDYVLYGGDHAKGTLRRGWATRDPSEAENNLSVRMDVAYVKKFVKNNIVVKRTNNTHYTCILENCVPYGSDVEYGHRVVFPGESRYVYSADSEPVLSHDGPGGIYRFYKSKGNARGRWVPGKYFVRTAVSKSNWQPVIRSMHAEYVRRFRMVFK